MAMRAVEILGLDQIVAAELLAGFRERAVGRQRLAVADPHGGRGRGRLQPVAGLEIAALDDGLGEGAIFRRASSGWSPRRAWRIRLRSGRSSANTAFRSLLCSARSPTSSRTGGDAKRHLQDKLFWAPKARRYRLDGTRTSPHCLEPSVGRTAAPASAERSCGEESPGSIDIRCRITSGGGNPRESATENEPPASALQGLRRARVKRCGKSAPRVRQRNRHGKPHREQDRIGTATRPVRASDNGRGAMSGSPSG